jgi:excisionase family DNA binding protein
MSPENHNKLAYGVREACEATNLSRALLFSKIASKELKSFKVGNRRLIHAEDLASFINSYRNSAA